MLSGLFPALTDYEFFLYASYVCAAGAALRALFLVVKRPRQLQPGLSLVATLLLLAAGAFFWSHAVADAAGRGRLAVLIAERQRPRDPWPRGTAHVPLGVPGSTDRQKAYIEPGGSFSPGAGTFGVSFWIVDPAGAVVATSDSIPLDQTDARYLTSRTGAPAIVVTTPHYSVTWTAQGLGRFHLAVESRVAAGSHLEIVFRGVGPAGGPLRNVELDGTTLRLNRQWTAAPVTQPTFLGEEGDAGWLQTTAVTSRTATSRAGWAAARFRISQAATLDIAAAEPPPAAPAPADHPTRLDLVGLDPEFEASLRSQIATLQIGLAGDQTRPGDPLNYPLQWLRDGAYVIVALARAGHAELAQALAVKFARDDFFGGFGAEGDGPGLALWMLAEVSALAADPAFDKTIWPDVQRKAGLIGQLLHATSDVRHAYSGPIVPQYRDRSDLDLVAGPSLHGLVDGRMDLHRPIFYVSSTNYAGLVAASRIARQVGDSAAADTWAREAAELRQAWRVAFVSPDWTSRVADERTAISGLWPSEIASKPEYAAFLEQRWQHDWPTGTAPAVRPLWTYFTVAEAHQWLRLDRADRVWATLHWLWRHQPMPGLYTLWEGSKEENDFGLWKQSRGWVAPPYVTPHYWTAAELLLLQIEMLAETQKRADDSDELVIGSGIPAAWLSHDIAVSGVGTSQGVVDWTWNGSEVAVIVHGKPLPVRLGAAFPSSARVVIRP